MRKFLVILLIILALASAFFIFLDLWEAREPEALTAPEPDAPAAFDQALYERFLEAEEAGDYVEMNAVFDENMSATGVSFFDDGYDPTHGGLIYTYTYSVSGDNGKSLTGNMYIVDKNLDMDAQSVGENDYFAVDRRDASDPEIVVMDSYRANSDVLIRQLCQILLDHEAAHPTKWERTLDSMAAEWAVHNMAYSMDYKIDHSQHVNLNNGDEKTDWFERAAEEFR